MKITEIMAIVFLTTTFARAEEKGFERQVTVCIEPGAALNESIRAQAITGKMFADAGIRVNWYSESSCPKNEKTVIHISLEMGTPEQRFPGALAFALPYEGIHIRVFAGRVRKLFDPNRVSLVLAHVLAHEIGHILQGVNRHSESGIMKAKWDKMDFRRMAYKPLAFAAEDVRLFSLGLQARAARAENHPVPKE